MGTEVWASLQGKGETVIVAIFSPVKDSCHCLTCVFPCIPPKIEGNLALLIVRSASLTLYHARESLGKDSDGHLLPRSRGQACA
jgi:hypothetical protein